MSFFRSSSTHPSTSDLNNSSNSGNTDSTPASSSNNKKTSNTKKSLTYILNINDQLDTQMKGHHSIGVNSLLYNKSDKCLISGGRDGQISIWKFNTDEANDSSLKDNNDMYDNLRSNNEIKNYIFSNLDNDLELRNLESSIENHGVSSVCVPNSKQLPHYLNHSYLHHFGWINDMKLLDDQSTIVSCSNDLSIKLWNYHSNMKLTLGYHDDYIKKIGFTKNYNNQLVSGGLDKVLKLWDIQKSKPISAFKFTDINSSIYSLDVNNDLVICSGPSNVITLFDRRDMVKPIKSFFGHTDIVRALILKDDSFLSGSSDSTIKLWDLRSTRVLRNFEMHNSPVWSLNTPEYSDNFSIFYSADKSGLLLKTDLRSSDINSKNISGGYFNYKVNESSGISTVIADVNQSIFNNDQLSLSTNADNLLAGINDIVECEEFGTVWTATSSNIHNSNTNFISSWSIPQTAKLVVYQGLVLNRKLRSLYSNNNNATVQTEQKIINSNNNNNANIEISLSRHDSFNDAADLVSQLSGEDLEHIDNALFSNSNGLDGILKSDEIIEDNNSLTSESYFEDDDDLKYPLATCFVGLLGNLNTQFLYSNDYDDDECDDPDHNNYADDYNEEDIDPFNQSNTKPKPLKIVRHMEINNDYVNEDNVLLLPFNMKPISNISGTNGLIRCKILNNRRHVATMDQCGCIYIFDILLGRMIHRVDKHLSVDSIETIEKGNINYDNDETTNDVIDAGNDAFSLTDRFEAICEKFQTQETLPTWCSLQVKSGQLFIMLKENTFTSCEIYSDDFKDYYKDLNNLESISSIRVNLGKLLVKSFFNKVVKQYINENNLKLSDNSRSSQLMDREKNNSFDVMVTNTTQTQNVKIPQPVPSTRSYTNTPAPTTEKKRGLFGRLKSNKKETTPTPTLKKTTSVSKPDQYLEKISQLKNTNELIKFISNTDDLIPILRAQEGYDDKVKENEGLPTLEYNDSSMIIVINEETSHETRPLFTININDLLNGVNYEEIINNLPIWISKGLFLNLYPVSTSSTNKIGFVVTPVNKDKTDANEEGLRLNALGTLRILRVLEFVKNKLPNEQQDCDIEILCRGQILANRDTLGTVKARVWKAGGDIELNYRIKTQS